MRNMGSMDEQAGPAAAIRSALPSFPDRLDLIRFATLAANSHNTQPWTFRLTDTRIEILPYLSRRTPSVDPDDHHLFVSLGCAAENLAIAAAARGMGGALAFDQSGDGGVVFDVGALSGTKRGLFNAIPFRQSTRGDYDGTQLGTEELQSLRQAAATPGVTLVLITEQTLKDKVRDLVISGNSTQLADPAFMAELKEWMRFSPRLAASSGDGLFSACSGSSAMPEWLEPLALNIFFTAESENEKYARQIASSAAIAVFLADEDDKEHWVLAGRACQRFALQATALGLKHAFLNQPVEVPELRSKLAALAGHPGRRPDIVMRLGRGAALPFSARRPVESVIVTHA